MTRSPSARLAAAKDGFHAETAAEMYFRAAIWMGANERCLSPAALRNRFGVSRATAYRWLSAYKAAKGVA